jgi:alkylation response protein AidB-like acyl-CoA dehydrogenase
MSSNTFQTEYNSASQFKVKIYFIQGFQLVQEKLVKVMANTQAALLMCFRVSKMIDDGKATMGQIAMTKAWVTERTREVTRLGR